MIPGRVRGVTLDLMFVTLGLVAPWIFSSRLWRWQAAWRYRRLAAQYDSRVIARTLGYSAPLEAALERLSPPPGRVLDVSTGTGAVALAVGRRFPNAMVDACDLSLEMLQVAQRSAEAAGLQIAWQQADGARLPYGDAGFDLVLLQNAPPTFRELARVVRPGGMLVLCWTKGGALLGFLQRRLERRLEALGLPVVEVGRGRGGLYVIARRSRAGAART